MKTYKFSTKRFRGIGPLYPLILIFTFVLSVDLFGGEVLNVASLKVSKNYPASFVLDLERNDIVTVNYNKNGGNADLNLLMVQVIDLNQQDEEVIASFTRSGRDFLAAYDGKYRVDFIYNGKASGFFKQRKLDLKIQMDLDGYGGMEEGEAKEVLRSTNIIIEEKEENAVRINYYLTEGDVLDISSSDSKAQYCKLYISQLARTFSLAQSPKISIPSNGTYSLKFFLEADETDPSLFNWKELLKRGDFLFRDLSIYRTRAADMSELMAANASTGADSGSDDLFNTGSGSLDATTVEEDNGLGFDLEKLLSEGKESTAESTAALIDMISKMNESLNKKNIRQIITAIPDDLQMKLEPEFNFSDENGNRKCEELVLQPTEFDIWFYWVGVGENAEQAFEDHNEEISKSYKSSLGQAKAEYLYGKFSNNQSRKRNPSYPTVNNYSQYLSEDAEYAIVDYSNMQRFLDGNRYQKLNKSNRRSAYITTDDGIAARPGLEDRIYFCACNNNKATPVNVFFKFFTIEIEEEEY